VTKDDIYSYISKKTKFPKSEVIIIFESGLECIKECIESAEKMEIQNFGSFEIHQRAQRTGLDIVRNKRIVIPERKIPKFVFYKKYLKEVMQKINQ
jgi:DNA-binding protein HU-beta